MMRGNDSNKQIIVSDMAPRTIALATAYQALDQTRPALMVLTFSCPTAITLAVGTTVTGEVRMGATNAVATGGGGQVAPYKKALTGALVIGANINTDDYETKSFLLPAGQWFAVRQLTGAGLLVVTATEQPMGA